MSQSVAIVTGAGQGIGESTAVRPARDFDSVALVARNRPHLERTATAVNAAGAESLVIDVDLADPAAARTVVDTTLTTFGRIDALLNIAGAVPQVDLFDMSDEQWDHGLALKLHGARRLTVAAWSALKEAKGSVVLISGTRRSSPKGPTPRWARSRHDMTVEEATAKFPQEAGIARYGEPDEIADLMAYLVSPAARWMTGSALRTDGGEVKSV